MVLAFCITDCGYPEIPQALQKAWSHCKDSFLLACTMRSAFCVTNKPACSIKSATVLMVKEVVLVPVNGRRNNQSLPLLVLVLLCVRNNHFLLLLLCVHVCDSHSAAIALHKRVVHFSEGLLQIDCAHMCVCV